MLPICFNFSISSLVLASGHVEYVLCPCKPTGYLERYLGRGQIIMHVAIIRWNFDGQNSAAYRLIDQRLKDV